MNENNSNNNIVFHYPGSVKFHLQQLNFKKSSIPKHILGFSEDYTFTKRRIEEYLDGTSGGPTQSWDDLSPLEQELCECNIFKLQQQQAALKGWTPGASAIAAPPSKKKRKAGKKTGSGGGGGPPFKILKRGAHGEKVLITAPRNNNNNQSETEASSSDDDDDSVFWDDGDDSNNKKPSSWSKKESKKLLKAVNDYNGGSSKIKWLEIAEQVFERKRSSQACYQHYHHFIVPRLVQGKWDAKEDSMILELHNGGQGMAFADIAKKLPNRNEFLVRDRFYHLMGFKYSRPKSENRQRKAAGSGRGRGRPKGRKGGKRVLWTAEEDKILIKNVSNIAANRSWEEILAQLPGRSKSAVSTRFSLNKVRYLKAASMQKQQLSSVKEGSNENAESFGEISNDGATEDKKKSPIKSVLRADALPFVPSGNAASAASFAPTNDGPGQREGVPAKKPTAPSGASAFLFSPFVPSYAAAAAGVASSAPKQNWAPTALLAAAAAGMAPVPRHHDEMAQDSHDDYDI